MSKILMIFAVHKIVVSCPMLSVLVLYKAVEQEKIIKIYQILKFLVLTIILFCDIIFKLTRKEVNFGSKSSILFRI